MDVVDRATITRALPVILDRANDQLQEVIACCIYNLQNVHAVFIICKIENVIVISAGVWIRAKENQEGCGRSIYSSQQAAFQFDRGACDLVCGLSMYVLCVQWDSPCYPQCHAQVFH